MNPGSSSIATVTVQKRTLLRRPLPTYCIQASKQRFNPTNKSTGSLHPVITSVDDKHERYENTSHGDNRDVEDGRKRLDQMIKPIKIPEDAPCYFTIYELIPNWKLTKESVQFIDCTGSVGSLPHMERVYY